MLSVFKRFGWVAPSAKPSIVGGDVKVEKAAQVPNGYPQSTDVESATIEWTAALSELNMAREHFDNADAEYFDAAVVALNLAHMKVDNAQNRLRKLMGVEKAVV